MFGDSRGQAVNTSANVMNGPSFNTVIGSLTSLPGFVTVSFRLSPLRCMTMRAGSTIAVVIPCTPSRTKRNVGGKHRSRATQLLTEDTIQNRCIYSNIRGCFCRISKGVQRCTARLMLETQNSLKVPQAWKTKKHQ